MWPHNPWNRLAIRWTIRRRKEKMTAATWQEKTSVNAWDMTRLADQSSPVVLGDFFKERGISSVDFIKVDVDGEDLKWTRILGPVD